MPHRGWTDAGRPLAGPRRLRSWKISASRQNWAERASCRSLKVRQTGHPLRVAVAGLLIGHVEGRRVGSSSLGSRRFGLVAPSRGCFSAARSRSSRSRVRPLMSGFSDLPSQARRRCGDGVGHAPGPRARRPCRRGHPRRDCAASWPARSVPVSDPRVRSSLLLQRCSIRPGSSRLSETAHMPVSRQGPLNLTGHTPKDPGSSPDCRPARPRLRCVTCSPALPISRNRRRTADRRPTTRRRSFQRGARSQTPQRELERGRHGPESTDQLGDGT
jgi:hypothetical protein